MNESTFITYLREINGGLGSVGIENENDGGERAEIGWKKSEKNKRKEDPPKSSQERGDE